VTREGIKCPDTALDAENPYTVRARPRAKPERLHAEPTNAAAYKRLKKKHPRSSFAALAKKAHRMVKKK